MTGLQIAIGESTFASFLLAMARTAGFVLVSPPFNTKAVPGRIKGVVAVALAIPLTDAMAASEPDLTSILLPLQLIVQMFLGLTLGYLVLTAVATVQSIGSLLDMVGGFQMSMTFDPLQMAQTAVMGRLYQLLAITLVFAGNGHLMILQGLSRSAQVMPIPDMSWEVLGRSVTAAAAGVLVGAVEVAAPVLAAILIVDVTLGLLTRAAPALNAFIFGFPLKILFTLLLSGLILARIPSTLDTLIRQAVETGMHLYGGG
jgi:flagellar biosynthetic protein FliR